MKSFCSTLVSIFILTLLPDLSQAQCPVIPAPANFTPGAAGHFELDSKTSIDFSAVPQQLQNWFTGQLKNLYGITLTQKTGKKAAISFRKSQLSVAPDFYSLLVLRKQIRVEYTSEASCFYALCSLLQLIENEGKEARIATCTLMDYPKFAWRGLHLDVSRHFFTVEEVKRYIDLMAFYKFNTFHWHLTDDQGWRIEIKQFPKLTETGAWRDSTVNKHYTTVPRTYTVEKYGGFYTQEQIREVVQYAAERYINVVPEIEMPGHARAALAAYPELSCTGQQQGVEGLWGIFDDIYCSKPEAIEFNKKILDEVTALFPSPYIHIGGDEAPKERWKQCPHCQQVIQENGLKNEHGLQSYFISQIAAHLMTKGKILIGWDEILEGGLPHNATVMSWRGYEGGIEAVHQGHSVVMSPGSHCYFDHYQSGSPNEPIAIGGFTPLEKVYYFDPVPKELNEQEKSLVLGAQANLWTEYIPDMNQLEYMAYPRALALSQALWTQHKPSYETFREVLVNTHLKLLDKKQVNYSKALFYPTVETLKQGDTLSYYFENKTPGSVYYYSVFSDGKRLKIPNGKGQQLDSLPLSYVESIAKAFQRFPAKRQLVLGISCFKDEHFLNYSTFSYQVHPGLGLPVKFITPPNKRYTGKEQTLTDGVIGRMPWNSSEWVGFDTTTIELEMDLGEEKQIQDLAFRFLDDESSWIHVPEQVDVYVSSDGKQWEIFMLNNVNSSNLVDINAQGRYVRVFVNSKKSIPDGKPGAGHVPWTFMDELVLDVE